MFLWQVKWIFHWSKMCQFDIEFFKREIIQGDLTNVFLTFKKNTNFPEFLETLSNGVGEASCHGFQLQEPESHQQPVSLGRQPRVIRWDHNPGLHFDGCFVRPQKRTIKIELLAPWKWWINKMCILLKKRVYGASSYFDWVLWLLLLFFMTVPAWAS